MAVLRDQMVATLTLFGFCPQEIRLIRLDGPSALELADVLEPSSDDRLVVEIHAGDGGMMYQRTLDDSLFRRR